MVDSKVRLLFRYTSFWGTSVVLEQPDLLKAFRLIFEAEEEGEDLPAYVHQDQNPNFNESSLSLGFGQISWKSINGVEQSSEISVEPILQIDGFFLSGLKFEDIHENFSVGKAY